MPWLSYRNEHVSIASDPLYMILVFYLVLTYRLISDDRRRFLH